MLLDKLPPYDGARLGCSVDQEGERCTEAPIGLLTWESYAAIRELKIPGFHQMRSVCTRHAAMIEALLEVK